ncbi:MAG: dihydrodipicolinate synthase family protein, partial [Phycisphaerales bacterium]
MVEGVRSKGRKLQGSMTALVTPFAPDGAVDWGCAARLADRQIEAGTDWLV